MEGSPPVTAETIDILGTDTSVPTHCWLTDSSRLLQWEPVFARGDGRELRGG